jgi:class 3 adenylate cyclase
VEADVRGLPSGVVTFVMTDIEGSTRMWQAAPEAMPEAIRRHNEIIAAAVAAHGGWTLQERGEGDSTFNVFANPSDAVAAAAVGQEALRAEVWPEGCPIRVRIAVLTGRVTIHDGEYMGTTINRTARLRAAARGGETFVAASTTAMLTSSGTAGAHLVELGPVALKDFAGPETVWALVLDGDPDPPPRSLRVPLPARLRVAVPDDFVGRTVERERLAILLKEAAEGRRRVALVAGDPGIGKSSLVAASAADAFDCGATVLYGACVPAGAPYQPFLDALGHYVAHTPRLDQHAAAHLAELARVLPAVSERAPGLPPPVASDPDTERYLFMNAVTSLLAEAGTDRPIVFVVEDLHWAGDQTLALLSHVVTHTVEARLLVVATYRPEAADALGSIRREQGAERIDLAGLDGDEMLDLVAVVTRQDDEPTNTTLARTIAAETGGNPFFATELLRHLVETGSLVDDGTGRLAMADRPSTTGLPASIREVVRERVGRLAPETGAAVRTAAVIGTEFDLEVLGLATGQEISTLVDLLEPASRARIVVESTVPARFAFAHALVAASLYDDLGATRRQLLHRRVGESLEQVSGADRDARLGELALHWSAAGERPKAIEYARRAGDAALGGLAPLDAMRWYRQALALVGNPQSGLGVDLLTGLGKAQMRVGDPAHRQTLLDAAHIAEQLDDADRLAAAALASSWLFMTQIFESDPEKVAVLESALAHLSTDDSPARARLLATLCCENFTEVPFDRSRELADQALAMADRIGDQAAWVYACVLVGPALDVPQLNEQRRDATARALELALASRDPLMAAAAANNHATYALRDASLTDLDRCLEVMAAPPDGLVPAALASVNRGTVVARHLLTGNPADADEVASDAFTLGMSTIPNQALLTYGIHHAEVRWQQGQLDEIIALFDAGAADGLHPFAAAVQAAMYAEAGRLDDAIPLLTDGSAVGFSNLPIDYTWLSGHVFYACAAMACAAKEPASKLLDKLAPYEHLMSASHNTCEGPVALWLGGLATVVGAFRDAEGWFSAALEMSRRCEARYFTARTLLEWSTMLHHSGRLGSTGVDFASEALALASEGGYAAIEARASRLLRT